MAESTPTPDTVNLSTMAALVISYQRGMDAPEVLEGAFGRGWSKGAGRAATALWETLTGLQGAEALAYAEHLADHYITAAVAPF